MQVKDKLLFLVGDSLFLVELQQIGGVIQLQLVHGDGNRVLLIDVDSPIETEIVLFLLNDDFVEIVKQSVVFLIAAPFVIVHQNVDINFVLLDNVQNVMQVNRQQI